MNVGLVARLASVVALVTRTTSKRVSIAVVVVCALLPWPASAQAVFTAGPPMSLSRAYHTATLLPNGKVLVVGGFCEYWTGCPNNRWILQSAELYDPTTNSWAPSGGLGIPRWGHTATLLPNGNVLIAGGMDQWNSPLSSTEIFDPLTNQWHLGVNLSVARSFHSAVLLPQGRVLIAGGRPIGSGSATTASELYDPSANRWTPTGALNTPRAGFVAALLTNGRVLAAGGWYTGSAEVYDPATGLWNLTGSLANTRGSGAGVTLPSGKVLVSGGFGVEVAIQRTELFDPAVGSWSIVGPLLTGRQDHTMTVLYDGKVLAAAGCWTSVTESLNTAEIFDPTTNVWTAAPPLNLARCAHTATLLPNGKVLIVGGKLDQFGGTTATTELYGPVTLPPAPPVEQAPPVRLPVPRPPVAPPTPLAKALVITHGWNSNAEDSPEGWVAEMARRACEWLGTQNRHAIGANDLYLVCQSHSPITGTWDVWVVDWRDGANTWSGILPDPEQARRNASPVGELVADQFRNYGYSHIHFIAHSAGSNLIDSATRWMKVWVPSITIHATFLDAYDPRRETSTYGSTADWADNYVDMRDLFWVPGAGDDNTALTLRWAYNINVTPSSDGCSRFTDWDTPCRHSRPYRFYGMSIHPDYEGVRDYRDHDPITIPVPIGFNASVENNRSIESLRRAYPTNRTCEVSGSICYEGGVPPTTLQFFPGAVLDTVVDGISGLVVATRGAGATVYSSLRMGLGSLIPGDTAPPSQVSALDQTELPSWIALNVTTTGPVNRLRFQWRFGVQGVGYLRIFVDGDLVRSIDQRYFPAGSMNAEEVYIGGEAGALAPGVHRIVFRLDGFGSNASGVELTNVELGTAALVNSPTGQPCAGFVDVDSGSGFCTSVEWLRNRAITLGCTSAASFCPNDAASRLAMAAFMSRLGASLSASMLWREQATGAIDLDTSPVVCQTTDYPVGVYPRRAIVDAVLSGTAGNTIGFGSRVVVSIDSGVSWMPLAQFAQRAVARAGHWGSTRENVALNLFPSQLVRFGIQVDRDALAGTTDLSDGRCVIRASIGNRTATTSPR